MLLIRGFTVSRDETRVRPEAVWGLRLSAD